MAETCYFPRCEPVACCSGAGQPDDRMHSDSAEIPVLSVPCMYTATDQ